MDASAGRGLGWPPRPAGGSPVSPGPARSVVRKGGAHSASGAEARGCSVLPVGSRLSSPPQPQALGESWGHELAVGQWLRKGLWPATVGGQQAALRPWLGRAPCVCACVSACVSVSACRSHTHRRVHEEGSVGGGPAPPRPALPFPGSEHLAQGSGRPSPLATRPGVRAAAALPPVGLRRLKVGSRRLLRTRRTERMVRLQAGHCHRLLCDLHQFQSP